MWTFLPEDEVRAVAGSVNYWWADARVRANHGLLGGGALAKLHIPSDELSVAAFDESNAFTSVRTPE